MKPGYLKLQVLSLAIASFALVTAIPEAALGSGAAHPTIGLEPAEGSLRPDQNPPTSGGGGASTVGGAAMYANKNIIQNAVNSPIHKTLVAAVKAAGLVDTLSGPGPFTVFAPTDNAFAKLPAGTVDSLVKPENKDALVKVLTYHVVPGKITYKQLDRLIKKSGGKATLKTVEGEDITASVYGSSIILTDAKGGTSTITTADVMQSNGVIHVVDTVLMP